MSIAKSPTATSHSLNSESNWKLEGHRRPYIYLSHLGKRLGHKMVKSGSGGANERYVFVLVLISLPNFCSSP